MLASPNFSCFTAGVGHWKSNQQRQRSISYPVNRVLTVNAIRKTVYGQPDKKAWLYTQPNGTLFIVPHRCSLTLPRIDRKLWICDVATPWSCSQNGGIELTDLWGNELPFLILFEIWEEGTPWQIFSDTRHNYGANEVSSATVQRFKHKKWNPLQGQQRLTYCDLKTGPTWCNFSHLLR